MFDYNNYKLESEKIDDKGHPEIHIRAKTIDDWHCPNCGFEKLRVRSTCPRKVYDLTADEHKATIAITERKYICPNCNEQYNPFTLASEDTFSPELRDYMGKEGIRSGARIVAERLNVARPVVQKEIDRFVAEYEQSYEVVPPSVVIIGKLLIKQIDRYVVYDVCREKITDILPDRDAMIQAIGEWKPDKILEGSEFFEGSMAISDASEKEAIKLGIRIQEWRDMIEGHPSLTEIQKHGDQAFRLFALTQDLMQGKEADPVLLNDFPAFSLVSKSTLLQTKEDEPGNKEEAYQVAKFKKMLANIQEHIDYRARFDVERVRILMNEDKIEEDVLKLQDKQEMKSTPRN